MCCLSSRMVYHIYPIWLALWWAATVATPWVKWISAQEVGGDQQGEMVWPGCLYTPATMSGHSSGSNGSNGYSGYGSKVLICIDMYWFSNLDCYCRGYISIHCVAMSKSRCLWLPHFVSPYPEPWGPPVRLSFPAVAFHFGDQEAKGSASRHQHSDMQWHLKSNGCQCKITIWRRKPGHHFFQIHKRVCELLSSK